MLGPYPLLVLTWVGFVLNLVLAGFLSVGFHRVYKLRNEAQWEARHFAPLSFSVVFSIIFIAGNAHISFFLSFSLSPSYFFYLKNTTNTDYIVCVNVYIIVERNLQLFGSVSGYFSLGTQARWILNNFFTFGFLAAYGLRAWVIHFDYNIGAAMLIQINSWDVTNPRLREQAEWFLANKTHYGSPKYLFQFLAVMVIILTLGIWGWIIVSFSTFYYGMVVIYAVIMLVIMQITRKVMRIEDLLFIRCELWLEFRILAGFFVVLGVLIIFGSAMDWDYCMFFIVEASVLAMAGMSSVATWWMLGRSKLINLSALMDKRLKQLGIENKEDEKVQHAPSLDMVLNDPEALRFFLQYLVRELSLENVFFFWQMSCNLRIHLWGKPKLTVPLDFQFPFKS